MESSDLKGFRPLYALAVMVAGLAFAMPGRAKADEACTSAACTFYGDKQQTFPGTCGTAPEGGEAGSCYCYKDKDNWQKQSACAELEGEG